MTKLSEYLKKECLIHAGIAKKLGVSSMTFSYIVTGRMIPKLQLAYEIEKITNGQVTLYDWINIKPMKRKKTEKNLVQAI